ncbi:MAG TPA: response regulator [Chitinophagaceae bacterium]
MPPASSYILCVDDDADDLLFITSALQQANAALRTAVAYNGVEALAFLEEVHRAHQLPSLVILDINMPRMDGKELLTALKKDARFASLPVVVYSTSGAGVDRLFCAHYGVELVTKPNTYDEVVSVMQYLYSTLNSPH